MRLSMLLTFAALLLGQAAFAADKPAAKPPLTPPMAGACASLPKPRAGPLPFVAGESLTYDVDVLGAKAGRMTFDVLPTVNKGAISEIPIRVRADSNTFFNKVRKITGEVVSYLRAKDLRPVRFHEDLVEGTLTRVADVLFGDRIAEVSWSSNQNGGSQGGNRYAFPNDALDYGGAIYLFRAVPLRVGQPFCFDTYAIKRMWRVEGKVESREHVSVPAGEFDAFHMTGMATSSNGLKREIHIWISDDARRIPVAALGVIDLGPVRAQLVELSRPDFKAGPVKERLEW